MRLRHALHGGIVVLGGEADGKGAATISGNHVNRNRGAAITGWQMTMTVDAHGNDLRGHELGAYENVKLKKR